MTLVAHMKQFVSCRIMGHYILHRESAASPKTRVLHIWFHYGEQQLYLGIAQA